MSIKLRFAALLGFCLAGLLLAWELQRRFEAQADHDFRVANQSTQLQLLNHWIDATSRGLPQFTADNAQADQFGRLLDAPSSAGVGAKLGHLLADAGLTALWLIRPDGSPALAVGAPPSPTPPAPLAPAEFVRLLRETPAPRFFARVGAEIHDVCVRRIHTTARTDAEWLVVSRRWDEAHLRQLGALAGASLTLQPALAAPVAAEAGASIVLHRPLLDWQGQPLQTLQAEVSLTAGPEARRADRRSVGLFLAFGVGLLLATALALQQWVVRPLGQIGASLATRSPAPIARLQADQSELGQVARLAQESFVQQRALQSEVEQRAKAQDALQQSEAALRRNLEERARLGRDLHDGVIQSLYAAGMGLAGIRSQLQPDQTEAAFRLEQTRAALNETIHDVRNFIIGLEPEALRHQSFAEAITSLLQAMQAHRTFQAEADIDEAVAQRLSLAQRVHALQIAREATSNALRHGSATRVTVALRHAAGAAEFEVADDGTGFDSAGGPPEGRGLASFRERARELGAELQVDAQPGNGTRVRLVFPLPAL